MVANKSFNEVKIVTNSRLHFGFLNLKSSKSYSYGGMGLSINKHPTILTVSKASKFQSNLNKSLSDKIYHFICNNKLCKKIRIDCLDSPQKHIGLGSGTQLTYPSKRHCLNFIYLIKELIFLKGTIDQELVSIHTRMVDSLLMHQRTTCSPMRLFSKQIFPKSGG